MRNSRLLAHALGMLVFLCFSNAFAQHSLQIDDGAGHYTMIKLTGTGNFNFPSGVGTILVSTGPGVSPAWMVGGNNNPTSSFIGTLTNDNFAIITSGVTRATFAGTPSASTPMLTLTNITAGIQGLRINGVPGDAIPGNTLAGNPGVWDVVVDGDEVVSGILKTGGGSLWFDGRSATHTITSNAPLDIRTTTNDPMTFTTHDSARMTIAANGFTGIGTINPVSMLHIVATPPDPTIQQPVSNFYLPDPVNHVLTVENMATNAKGNGIAIIIHNPSGSIVPDLPTSDGAYNNNQSNYMTYYNDIGDHTHIKGRIEGFSYENYKQLKAQIDAIQSNTDLYNPFNYFTFNVTYNSSWFGFDINNFVHFTPPTLPTISLGSLPSLQFCSPSSPFDWISYPCGISGGSWPSISGGSVGSISVSNPFSISSPLTNLTNPFSVNYAFINGIKDQFIALPYKEKAAMIATNKVQAAINFALSFLGGVTYETGSGDYAEWLERGDHNEKISIGDVVGVIGDKITKNTENATHFMVASWKPCVLGNMPEAGKEAFYHKVAFMGQIPVKMICAVKKGDYIVPDGANNGYASAISPKDISAGDINKVFGVAWEDAPSGAKLVKIAVGLKPHEMIKVIQDQAQEITRLETKAAGIEHLKAEIAEIKATITSSQTAKYSKKKAKHTAKSSSALSSN